ncbi:MAG: four helix bundle protein [Synergistaceae bacterium]|nr:four helix bundle protein [Synergistaceae bacterium]
MEQEKTVKSKSKKFAVRIVNLYKFLCNEKKEYVLSKQLLRSGTSIGANIAESETAISKKDFLAKLYIALKETNESLYWLDLLHDTEYLTKQEYDSLYFDCEELRKMLSSSTMTINSTLHSSNSKLTKGGEAE